MVPEALRVTATTDTKILQRLLALEHLDLERLQCCKLQYLLVLERANAANRSVAGLETSQMVASFSASKGPQDHWTRGRGPPESGTRAIPGPSHSCAKKPEPPRPRHHKYPVEPYIAQPKTCDFFVAEALHSAFMRLTS